MRATLQRAFGIIDAIQNSGRRGKTAGELSTELDIPIRTLYRYLEVVTLMQPIYSERDGKRVKYKWLRAE